MQSHFNIFQGQRVTKVKFGGHFERLFSKFSRDIGAYLRKLKPPRNFTPRKLVTRPPVWLTIIIWITLYWSLLIWIQSEFINMKWIRYLPSKIFNSMGYQRLTLSMSFICNTGPNFMKWGVTPRRGKLLSKHILSRKYNAL